MTKKQTASLSLFLSPLLFAMNTSAQTTINASSNHIVIEGNMFEYSIGEMSLINTERNENLIITQGHLQPANTTSSEVNFNADNLSSLSNKIKVYPNPTEDILFIETSNEIAQQLNFQIIDASGKVVLGQNNKQILTNNKLSIQLSALTSGTYFLLVHEGNEKSNLLSFKIQKME